MVRSGEARFDALAPHGAQRPLALGIVQQLAQGRRERSRVARRHLQPVGSVLDPVADAAGCAGDDGPAEGERLDADQAEQLSPRQVITTTEACASSAGERLSREPAPKRDPILDAEPRRQRAHRLKVAPVAADHDLGVELARGAHEHLDALWSHDSPGEHHPSAVLVPAVIGQRKRAEQRRERATLDAVHTQMPIDHRRVRDRRLSATWRSLTERVARWKEPGSHSAGFRVWPQPRTSRFGTHPDRAVGRIPGPAGSRGLRRACCGISVNADEHRRDLLKLSCDIWILKLVKVNYLRHPRDRLADALARRRLTVEEIAALMEADPRRALVRVDPSCQHVHLNPAGDERGGAGHDVCRHATVSRPAGGDQQHRSGHPRRNPRRRRPASWRSIAARITAAEFAGARLIGERDALRAELSYETRAGEFAAVIRAAIERHEAGRRRLGFRRG